MLVRAGIALPCDRDRTISRVFEFGRRLTIENYGLMICCRPASFVNFKELSVPSACSKTYVESKPPTNLATPPCSVAHFTSGRPIYSRITKNGCEMRSEMANQSENI